ncbi:palmitoyltransferase ZDHHC3-like isoform X2 [Actinia tenebrosa]|uniref:Palmitoyltransferase n=1 Tax=Actinia tenebrosa TaxID=6105 RepID=A0A6P8ISV9_ACTTE|nr:palmitoyltransferase ZDHHC3-like isoform X2 [Actinia tenebrosa]
MAVFRRDPCGICCIILTYSAVIYADYCIVNHVVIPTISDSIWGTIHVIIFNIIAFLLLFSHSRASFSDPGVVPLPTESLDFSEINKARNSENGESEWTACTKCEAYRPPRAHHCRICRRCIKKMDHHCPWINNCVGESNQKYFFLFLFYTGLLSLYAIILVAVSWTKECVQCSKEYDKRTRFSIYTIILMIESCLFGLFVMAMMCDQFSSITEDLTAIENIQKQVRTSRKPRTALLAEVFGRGSYLLWFCPCTSTTTANQVGSSGTDRFYV